MKSLIERFLDLVFPFFKRFFDRTTFRYAACGGANTVFDIVLFFIIYNFVLKKEYVTFPFIVISPHIASFLLAFTLSFPTGFLLMRFIVFQDSVLKGRIQLFRYFLSVCVSLLMNYAFLKILVEKMHIFPTVSKLITTVFVVAFSYFTQKHFSFKAPR